ncbi:MAG: hypothetical protein ABSG36_15840 [Acidimicrobiales bacterium]
MRPQIDDRAVAIVREAVPEFESHYHDLLDIYDEDLTPQVVFNELAELVSALLLQDDSEETLDRCVGALELVAAEPGADGTELIGFCFLDQLPSFALQAIRDLLYDDIGETVSDRLARARTGAPQAGCGLETESCPAGPHS